MDRSHECGKVSIERQAEAERHARKGLFSRRKRDTCTEQRSKG
jgi:hypothetical protein